MKSQLRFRILSLVLVLTVFSACGRWNPATSSDLRDTATHKKEKGGDRYRFVDPEGKKIVVSGKNLNVEGNEILVRKDRNQNRYPIGGLHQLEKYKLSPGRTIGLILGITIGTLALGFIPVAIDIAHDDGS